LPRGVTLIPGRDVGRDAQPAATITLGGVSQIQIHHGDKPVHLVGIVIGYHHVKSG
jgi:hypothetical protein